MHLIIFIIFASVLIYANGQTSCAINEYNALKSLFDYCNGTNWNWDNTKG